MRRHGLTLVNSSEQHRMPPRPHRSPTDHPSGSQAAPVPVRITGATSRRRSRPDRQTAGTQRAYARPQPSGAPAFLLILRARVLAFLASSFLLALRRRLALEVQGGGAGG